jgi:DHA1 family bicyclomycin/chloramphenicol resistance-like MFS transporter
LNDSAPSAGLARPGLPRPAVAIRFAEFVALAAALQSTQALAIDSMLPALPAIARALGVSNPNHGQWIVTAYMAGLGLGQLFWGLLSDRFGRRPVLLGGLALYVAAALSCGLATSFETLLAGRCLHGIAAASMTVVRSAVRDQYAGRRMARVMSLMFMVFLTVPILAPSLGQLVLTAASWRYIFIACGLYGTLVWLWACVRLPETLHPEYRLSLQPRRVLAAARLVLGNRISIFYTFASTLLFGALIAYIATVQQVFADVFRRPSLMPVMFALCAVFMGVAAYCNSRLVERLGMRLISHTALLIFIGVAALHLVVAALGRESMWTFVALQGVTMAAFSLAASNFGAMAMEPVGSVAGMGASLQGFISTGAGALVAALIGRSYHGSIVPIPRGALCCGLIALTCVLAAERGRLFRRHHGAPSDPGLAQLH